MWRKISRPANTFVTSTALWLGAAVLLSYTLPARAQKIASDPQAAEVVAVEQLVIKDGVVTGQVRNKTQHPVRDVQLFIRYTWLWENERNPGNIDPGTSTYYTLRETLAPGETVKFTYTPSPPLPNVSGGRFEISAKLAGFTEVIPQPQR